MPPAVLIPARESISTAYTSCSAAQPSITAHGRYRAMADAPSWQPLPPRRRKRQKSDTTPAESAFEQKAKANADHSENSRRSTFAPLASGADITTPQDVVGRTINASSAECQRSG